MAITPLSTSTSYCSAADLLVRYDWRVLGELLADSDSAAPLTQSQVLASTTLAELLLASSGEVEAACLVSERYIPDDLAALTGGALSLLKDLVADLTVGRLYKRRPSRDPALKPPTATQDAREMLDLLREGQRIFGTIQHAQSGQIDATKDVASDVVDRRGVSVLAERMFGRRGWRTWE